VSGAYDDFAVLLGHGDGTFAAPALYSSGASYPEIADLDEDGHLDLVLHDYETETIVFHRGTGTGSFDAPIAFPSGSEPDYHEIGDVDEDGHPDIVVGGDTSFWLLRSLGGGSFAAPVAFGNGGAFLLEDATGDGHLDVLELKTTTQVLAGAGDGTFPSSIPLDLLPSAVDDFDGDGIADVAGVFTPSGENRNLIAVQRGLGGGGFAPRSEHSSSAGVYDWLVGSGDFDGDGRRDLVSVGYSSGALDVHHGNGDGTFGRIAFQETIPTSAMTLADFDGDGRLDLASQPGLSIRLGNGGGQFGPVVFSAAFSSVSQIHAADLDADGDVDLVLRASSINVLLGNGDGTFGPAVVYPTGAAPTGIALGDLDGDGDLDIVASHNTASLRVAVLRSNGDGTFQAPQYLNQPARGARTVAIGDMNGDGKLDIVDGDSFALVVRLGDGAGGFAPGVSYNLENEPYQMALADLDEDGRLDAIWKGPRIVTRMLGTGGGALGPFVNVDLGSYYAALSPSRTWMPTGISIASRPEARWARSESSTAEATALSESRSSTESAAAPSSRVVRSRPKTWTVTGGPIS
jgi:hypothetical protein